jgi:hypothetical protein
VAHSLKFEEVVEEVSLKGDCSIAAFASCFEVVVEEDDLKGNYSNCLTIENKVGVCWRW